jgi:hypothetical protein
MYAVMSVGSLASRSPTPTPTGGHFMSPTGVAVLLLLALVTDYLSVGPNSIRDRLAFLLALPAIHEGFDGSPLDNWTVGALTRVIDTAKHMTGGAYIAGAVTSAVLGAAVGVLAIYTVGALMPDKFSARLGRFAAISFPTSAMYRINYKLWSCATLLGLLSDLPGGSVGGLLRAAITMLTGAAIAVPFTLFGVS